MSLVHVLGGPPFSESFLAGIGTAFSGSPLADATGPHREIAQALLEMLAEDVPGGVPVLLDPADADSAPDAVVRFANDNGVDCIVVAAHGEALKRAVRMVGSFSGHLGRHAPCPVLLLPPGVVVTWPSAEWSGGRPGGVAERRHPPVGCTAHGRGRRGPRARRGSRRPDNRYPIERHHYGRLR
ncbi:MAG: universal stress protein [Thermoleophilia bacterium]|nr:universal stress protein [Thermoleophilia bacterium]